MSTTPRLAALAATIALAALTAGHAAPAHGASFTVNATRDAVDAAPGDGTCADSGGACTLRAAIMETNALAGADEISLPAGTYALSIPGADEDAGATGDLDVTGELTLVGAGAAASIIDGAQLDGVFHLDPAGKRVVVNISAIAIRNGLTPSSQTTLSYVGGGISSAASLRLKDVIVSDNRAVSGGGIWNTGVLIMVDSTISGNSASSFGAGMNSTGDAQLTNVTVSGNTAGSASGGILVGHSSMSIKSGTITGNGGGGLDIGCCGTLSLLNTIVSGNSGGNCDPDPVITSQGHNLSSDNSCNLTGPGDIGGVDPQLTGLQNNGGPTLTHGLYPSSPAIDAGDPNACPATDQRGVARPQGAACDIGAYEYGTPPTAPPTEPPTDVPPPADPATEPPTPGPTPKPKPSTSPSPSPTPNPSASAARAQRRLPTPAAAVLVDAPEQVVEEDAGGGVSPMAAGLAATGALGIAGSAATAGFFWHRRRRNRLR